MIFGTRFLDMITSSAMQVYLMVLSGIAMGMIVLSGGMLLSTAANTLFISEQAYLDSGHWEIQQCDGASSVSKRGPTREGIASSIKSEEEIIACVEKAEQKILLKKQYNDKETYLGFGILFLLGIVLYGLSFPRFLRLSRK